MVKLVLTLLCLIIAYFLLYFLIKKPETRIFQYNINETIILSKYFENDDSNSKDKGKMLMEKIPLYENGKRIGNLFSEVSYFYSESDYIIDIIHNLTFTVEKEGTFSTKLYTKNNNEKNTPFIKNPGKYVLPFNMGSGTFLNRVGKIILNVKENGLRDVILKLY